LKETILTTGGVSPSQLRTNEILITPKDFTEWQNEAYAPISRISVQLNPDGKPNFGVSGYNPYRIEYEKPDLNLKDINIIDMLTKEEDKADGG
jgi:hypothetical protein